MEENTNVTVGGEESGAQGATETSNEQGQQTYTQEEYEKNLQAETDRRVTDALKTAQAKWQKDMEERIEKARKEAEERAKMSAEEIAKADAEKNAKRIEQERADFEHEKLEFQVERQLADKKYPAGFAKMITAMGADEVENNIKILEEALSAYKKSIVDEITKGKPPKTGTPAPPKPFSEMTYTEQVEYLKNNPQG
jgi:hypothetical protein|nr:MAG TPA: Major capsid protein [Caudoviricetes sp.]